MPHLASIAYTPADVERHPADHYARVSVSFARLVEGHGIEGDTKGSRGRRQLNVMFAEVVARLREEGFRTNPGQLGEQLVIAGLEPAMPTVGTRLRIGAEAIIEVTLPREPCKRFAHVQGRPMEAGIGQIGVMARVITGGEITVGDPVEICNFP